MESWLIRITDYLLAQSWQIAILTVAVAVASFALRNRSAHIRYLLWLIVLAKCLMPPLHSVPVAVLPPDEPKVAALTPAPLPDEGTSIEFERPQPLVTGGAGPASRGPEDTLLPGPTAEPRITSVRARLAAVWIVGTVAFLLIYLLKALRMQMWLYRQRRALPAGRRCDMENVFSAHGITRLPPIWLIDGVGQPFVWGLVRGNIYLPANLAEVKDAKLWTSLIGHELSHVLRFDAAVNVLQVVAQIAFWFHPFVWWANRKTREEREKCCDEATIARLHTLPEDYGSAIVETLAAQYESIRPVPSLAVAGPVRNVEERIRIMLRPGRRFYRRPTLLAAIVVLLLALLTVPTTLVLSSRAEAKSSDSPQGKPAVLGELEYIDHLSSDENLARPTSIALSPDGRHLYVTAFGSRCVAILGRDHLTGYMKLLNTIPLRGAFACRVSPNGRYVVCADVKSGPDYYMGMNTVTLFERDQSTGDLSLLDSIRNEEDGIDSLDNVVDICFSPNSEFVYVIGRRSAAVTAFRITDNKKFVLVQSNKGQDQCFDGGRGIAVSPDGEYLYVTSVKANTLAVLQRDAETGTISLEQVLRDEQGEVHGLCGVWDVTCSPDGRFIYTNAGRKQGDEHDDAVCTFERTGDGTLSFVQELRTNEAQIGLAGGSRLRVSPDGKHLYALGMDSDSMVSFQRNPNTGKLTYLQTHSFPRIDKKYVCPADLGISPDGAYVYVVGEGLGLNGIILLKRLPWTKKGTAETLYETACSGDRSLLESAIKQGVSINARGQGGYTALHWAAQKNQKEASTLLLDAGADVNARTGQSGWTPLHVAAMQSNKDVSKILIDRGADLQAENQNNRMTPIVIAQRAADVDFASFLLDKGARFDTKDQWGWTPLHQAASQGDIAFADLLIRKGADVNAKDDGGWTPLFSALRRNEVQMIEWLIAKGADVNAKSQAGQAPLHMACGIGMLDVVECLLTHGADVQVRTDKGDTPLSQARENRNADLVELLRKHGATE